MPLHFQCSNPECNQLLQVADEAVGKRTKCPRCSSVQFVPGNSDKVKQHIRDPLQAGHKAGTTTCPKCGKRFETASQTCDACGWGKATATLGDQSSDPPPETYDLEEPEPTRKKASRHEDTSPVGAVDGEAAGSDARALAAQIDRSIVTIKDPQDWEAAVKQWKEELPVAESAYTPSGRMPGSAFVLMLLGAAGATVVGFLCLLLTEIVMRNALGFALVWLKNVIGGSLGQAVISAVTDGMIAIVLFVFGILLLVVWAYVTSNIINHMGRMAKNRSVGAAACLCAASTILAALLVFVLGYLSAWLTILLLIGPLLAACILVCDSVNTAKFCEDCDRYMDDHSLATIAYPRVCQMVNAMKGSDASGVLKAMEAPRGKTGSPRLYVCPQCKGGYLDCEVTLKAQLVPADKPDETTELNECWLAGSCALKREETERFLHFSRTP